MERRWPKHLLSTVVALPHPAPEGGDGGRRPCVAGFGGGGRESNPPGGFHRLNGFEDRGAHQALGRLRDGG